MLFPVADRLFFL